MRQSLFSDRIREEMKNSSRNTDLKDLVNRCITQTLTRSIYTSLTTFVMVAVLYVMGVSSIKEFALPAYGGNRLRSLFICMYHRRALVCYEDREECKSSGCFRTGETG